MSCGNKKNFYSCNNDSCRVNSNNSCSCNECSCKPCSCSERRFCDNDDDDDALEGLSCPFHNNNDCDCADSLRGAAKRLTNQRVIIHVDGCKMCVVIVGIGKCFLKTVNPCTQKIVYFNLSRIDNIEDVLPRCY